MAQPYSGSAPPIFPVPPSLSFRISASVRRGRGPEGTAVIGIGRGSGPRGSALYGLLEAPTYFWVFSRENLRLLQGSFFVLFICLFVLHFPNLFLCMLMFQSLIMAF